MSTYARVQNNVVVEKFTPPAGVAITDCFHPDLLWVNCSSDPNVEPGWNAVETNGVWDFTAPTPPTLTLAQQASAALNSGVLLTLSGSITLAATLFPCDSATWAKLEPMAAMASRGVLPQGAVDYAMKDSSGFWHHFTATQYGEVSGAIGSYTSALVLIIDGNPLNVTTLPPNTVVVTCT